MHTEIDKQTKTCASLPALNQRTHADYIDITRVIAAFCIVVWHMSTDWIIIGGVTSTMLDAQVAFFFLIAGYFSKNVNLINTYKRFTVLIVPFLIWEYVPALCFGVIQWDDISLFNILHLKIQFNGTLWFLRVLIILTLLLPLLYKLRKYALPTALIIFILLSLHMSINYEQLFMCNGRDIEGAGFFILGIGLQPVSLSSITSFIKKHMKSILLIGVISIALIDLYGALTQNRIEYNEFVRAFGIVFTLAVSLFINDYLPKVAKLLIKAAPATYLVYVSHFTLVYLIRYDLTIPWISNFYFAHPYIVAISASILTIFICSIALSLLKRFAPALLPIIAGVRIKK